MTTSSFSNSSLPAAEVDEIDRALQRYTENRWGDWKSVSPDAFERRRKSEKARLETFTAFLSALGKIAKKKSAQTLLYPGAGLDLISPLITGLPKLVLVDPSYSVDESNDQFRSRIETIIAECFDQEACAERGGQTLRIEFEFLTTRRELFFVSGTIGDIDKIEKTLGEAKTLYLVKGTAQPALLLPPPSIARLNPQAWGVHFPSAPSPVSVVGQMYNNVLFSEQLDRGELTIFETYLPAAGWYHLGGQESEDPSQSRNSSTQS